MLLTAPDQGNEAAATVETRALTKANIEWLEHAYLDHYRDVFRYALWMTRSQSEAEEVVGDVFLHAAQARGPLPSSVLPWLLSIARRLSVDRWRRAKRLASRLTLVRRESPPGEALEFWLWFDSVARVLTPRQREVLILRYQRDLSDRDIASILGLTESGVRSLAARALEALRAHPELM